jgi:abortive infection bacteriophage resistance protein
MKYTKPATTYKEQINILKTRGLIVDNEARALDVLQNISYYRLSAYYLPFQLGRDAFKKGTHFDDIVALYEFDRHLRDMLWDAIESIEISVRTQITYHLAHTYGVFGYVNAQNFHKKFKHAEWMGKLAENINRSHEVFIKHYHEKYTEETNLPIWMVTEVAPFGQLSQLFHGLQKKDKQAIAHMKYALDQLLLTSWLHTLSYIRNLCAHHARVWNRTVSIKPMIPRNEQAWQKINNQKIFFVLLIIKKLMSMTEEWQEWQAGFIKLIDSNPAINLNAMGFPDDWKKQLS